MGKGTSKSSRVSGTDRAPAEALADPGSVYSSPEEVIADESLTATEKIEVLKRWAYDLDELAVAEEEGMRDGLPGLLRRILLALDALDAGIDPERTPPTKQGGI
jgi:hypothetical protein